MEFNEFRSRIDVVAEVFGGDRNARMAAATVFSDALKRAVVARRGRGEYGRSDIPSFQEWTHAEDADFANAAAEAEATVLRVRSEIPEVASAALPSGGRLVVRDESAWVEAGGYAHLVVAATSDDGMGRGRSVFLTDIGKELAWGSHYSGPPGKMATVTVRKADAVGRTVAQMAATFFGVVPVTPREAAETAP